jgi:hypothetical protein
MTESPSVVSDVVESSLTNCLQRLLGAKTGRARDVFGDHLAPCVNAINAVRDAVLGS